MWVLWQANGICTRPARALLARAEDESACAARMRFCLWRSLSLPAKTHYLAAVTFRRSAFRSRTEVHQCFSFLRNLDARCAAALRLGVKFLGNACRSAHTA